MGRPRVYATAEDKRLAQVVYHDQYCARVTDGFYTDAEVLALRAEIWREVVADMYAEVGSPEITPPVRELLRMLGERLSDR